MRLKDFPFFLFLLPVYFFIFNSTGYLFHFSFDELKIFLILYAVVFLIFFVNYFFRKFYKSLVICEFLFFFFFLFFGNIKDSFVDIPFLYSYKILIALLVLIPGLNFLLLKKKETYSENQFQFLNKLLPILIGIQLFLFIKQMPQTGNLQTPQFEKSTKSKHPNIHLILLDAYPGFVSLKNHFHYDNEELKQYFLQNNCYVFDTIYSNYKQTYYSINSLLNMQYISYLDSNHIKKYSTILQQTSEINQNVLVKLLQQNGYHFYNNSIFKVGDKMPINSQLKFSTFDKLLIRNIFWNRFINDNLWRFTQGRLKINSVYDQLVLGQFYQIQHQITDAKNVKNESPAFTYTHLLMPHEPYFTDSVGNLKMNISENETTEEERFIEYLKYTNLELKKIFHQIKSQDSTALIIMMSDHGYRSYTNSADSTAAFNNLLILYSQQLNPTHLSKIHSNVNLFRMIANDFFNQNLPFLPDTLFDINEGAAMIQRISL